MALFQAFRAVRPASEKAEKVAALPYDVVSREEARKLGEKNPESFLHIDRAEMDLDPETDLYDPKVYQKARENLDRFQKEGILIQDEKPHYYLYELIRKGRSQTGIVGVSSIDDYMNGVIKKHELTREDKEQDRIRHVDVCDATQVIFFWREDIRQSFLIFWKLHVYVNRQGFRCLGYFACMEYVGYFGFDLSLIHIS